MSSEVGGGDDAARRDVHGHGRCAITLDPGNATEYRTRVKIVPLNPDKVKALCAEGKVIEGAIQ